MEGGGTKFTIRFAMKNFVCRFQVCTAESFLPKSTTDFEVAVVFCSFFFFLKPAHTKSDLPIVTFEHAWSGAGAEIPDFED
jgi:hypothetical protein